MRHPVSIHILITLSFFLLPFMSFAQQKSDSYLSQIHSISDDQGMGFVYSNSSRDGNIEIFVDESPLTITYGNKTATRTGDFLYTDHLFPHFLPSTGGSTIDKIIGRPVVVIMKGTGNNPLSQTGGAWDSGVVSARYEINMNYMHDQLSDADLSGNLSVYHWDQNLKTWQRVSTFHNRAERTFHFSTDAIGIFMIGREE